MRQIYPLTYNLFDKYAQTVVADMKTNLAQNSASGKLLNSIRYKLIEGKDTISIAYLLEDYWRYVDEGRKPGKQPPLSVIKKWTQLKGIPESAAYPIARKIGKVGIKPTWFFTKAVTKNEKKFLYEVEKTMAKDMANNLRKILKKQLKNN